MIPELRYAGKEQKHKYRLDFSVLNGHNLKLTGFEISPASTHLRIKGMKGKTQKEVNEELSAAWEKEIGKRNDYFEEFGIATITFGDKDLNNLDICFQKIKRALQERSVPNISIDQALHSLEMSYLQSTLLF